MLVLATLYGIPIFSSVRKKIEKNFWDMEIIGNRRKISDMLFYINPEKSEILRKIQILLAQRVLTLDLLC